MVTRAQSQPDHVQVDFCNTFQGKPGFVHTSLRQIVNNQYPCRLVNNQSISDLNILKQEMLATRATWKGWLAASDSCKPVIPGKSYAEVLKTDSQLQCMHSCAKNGVASWWVQGTPISQGRSFGKPTKKSNISSDSPAHKNIDRVNTKAAPDELQTPVALFNRFSPLHEVADLNETCVSDTLNDFDGTFFDFEGDLGILELNSENAVSGPNHDDFQKLLLKKRVDQKLVQQAKLCSEYVACKQQMDNAFGVIPLSPLMLYQGPKTNNTANI